MDGTRSFDPTWSSATAGCPLTYEVGRVENSTLRPLTPAEKLVITHDNTNGKMSFVTSDFSLDGEIWTIRLYKRSTYSIGPKKDGVYTFDIEFRDICWESKLQPADFENPEYVFDLWQFESMKYTQMIDLSQAKGYCGGVTSVLEYIAGPAFDPITGTADLSNYVQVPSPNFAKVAIEGFVSAKNWLGIHTLRIKSTLGS